MNKAALVPLVQMALLGAGTFGGVKVLMGPPQAPDLLAPRRRAALEEAAGRKFRTIDVAALVGPFALGRTKDGNAGEAYTQAMKAHYMDPSFKSAFETWSSQPPGPGRDASAAPLLAGQPIKLLEKAVSLKSCELTDKTIKVKSIFESRNSLVLPPELLGSYVQLLWLKGRQYGATGRKDLEKMYYQAGITVGIHLTQDVSPMLQLTGLNAIAESARRLADLSSEGGQEGTREQLAALLPTLGQSYPKDLYEDILLLSGDPKGLEQLMRWLQDPAFQKPYFLWTVIAVLTHWMPQEKAAGPHPARAEMLQKLSVLPDPYGKLMQTAAKDLEGLASDFEAAQNKATFIEELEARGLQMLAPIAQELYGEPLSIRPAPSGPAAASAE